MSAEPGHERQRAYRARPYRLRVTRSSMYGASDGTSASAFATSEARQARIDRLSSTLPGMSDITRIVTWDVLPVEHELP